MHANLHILPAGWEQYPAPNLFTFPFAYRPHPWTELAAKEVLSSVHTYMAHNPQSELWRSGKMFGVLVVSRQGEKAATGDMSGVWHEEQAYAGQYFYLAAFSALLDGSFYHDGFVPPVYDWSAPDGFFRREEAAISALRGDSVSAEQKQQRRQRSRLLQRRLFGEYHLLNSRGESATPLEIFRNETQLLTEEEYFERRRLIEHGVDVSNMTFETDSAGTLPPSGTGDCCAPKLLQYAFKHCLKPVCMGEFWIGAAPKREVRSDGAFYPACSGRCKPLLRHMLAGIEVETNPLLLSTKKLAEQTKVVYQDEWLAVVLKPSGLLTIPAKDGGYSLVDWAAEHLGASAAPAHRLDQDTSGLVVICKDRNTLRLMTELFEKRKVEKHYEAVLTRVPVDKPCSGVISLPLLKNPLDSPRQMVSFEHGKQSQTKYEIRKTRADGSCLVDFYPLTGRTHQLRIHSAHLLGLGAPIVGDRLYGSTKKQNVMDAENGVEDGSELMLHAAELTFPHPVTGTLLHFHYPKFS